MKQYRLLGSVLLWQLAASICYYAVFAATPFFREDLGLTGTTVGLVVTSLTLGYAMSLLPLGALTDRYGEYRMLVVGLIGLALGSLLVSESSSFLTLLGSVFVLGALYGTAMPGTNKAIFGNVPEKRQNLATGIKQVGVTAGSGISAVMITRIADFAFWEAGFYAASVIGIAVVVVFAVAYEPTSTDGEMEFPNFRALFGNRSYRSLCIAGWFLGAALFTTVGYTIIYLNEAVGVSIAIGGLVLAGLQATGSIGRIVFGWLSDILPGNPRRRIGGVLFVQALASTVLFITVGFVNQRLVAMVAFLVLGFFILGFTGVYYSCLATLVSNDEMGGATAGGQLALTSGALLAPPTFGFISDAVGYRESWFLLAGLTLLATGFILRVIRAPTSDESQCSEPSRTTTSADSDD